MRVFSGPFRSAGLVLIGWLATLGPHLLEAAPVVPVFDRFYRGGNEVQNLTEGGLLLLTELNCVACHRATAAWAAQLPIKSRLSLAEVGTRLPPAALAAFVTDPHGYKPGTLMPSLNFAADENPALLAYLGSLRGTFTATPTGDMEAGRRLYHGVGCVGCHAPAADTPPEIVAGVAMKAPQVPSVPLALAADYERSALVQFLVNPLAVRPAGRMPASGLSGQEAANVAAYLQRGYTRASTTAAGSPPTETALVAAGRRQFASRGCVACHVGDSSLAAPPPEAPALGALGGASSQGCLAERPAPGVPDFRLDEGQRRALRRALDRIRSSEDAPEASARQEVERFMARMNCYACHARDGRGGVEAGRVGYFGVTDSAAHSLGDMGNQPPALNHTGRKLTRGWWEKLLWGDGGGVRPHMTVRMPKFGREVCEPVLAAWVKADQRAEPVAIDTSGRLPHQRAASGRILMGTNNGGLGCITCHGLRDRKSLGVPAIALTHTVARLHPEYFKELLLNPQAVQPGTPMPPLFMGRAKADVEIEQLWTYLKEIDQQLLPEGLLQSGEYELKPEKEGRPIVFRTFLDGAGLQAVAVGFPAERHAAFDAAEVRWALTWKGRFVDALTTWEERAMTPAKPLGEAVTSLPAWMPLARLPAASAAWPATFGAAAGYRYGGYTLGADGTPTFHYGVGSIEVADTLRPDPESGGFRRTLVVRGGGNGWYFRGAARGAMAVPVHFDAASQAIIEEVMP